jgi:hypothetical protein
MYDEEEGPRRIVLNLAHKIITDDTDETDITEIVDNTDNYSENNSDKEEHVEEVVEQQRIVRKPINLNPPKPILIVSKPKVYQVLTSISPTTDFYPEPEESLIAEEETFKLAQIKKQAKLASFFGDEAPVDVPLEEVQKRGLEALLLSKVPLAYFLVSCMREHANENIFFLLECEHYVSSEFESIEQQERAARRIIETYIDEKGNFQV